MNWNMLGHEWAINLLKESITEGNLRHAYLITGPQGVGRRTLALRLAQAVNCPQPLAPGEPCLTCHTCQKIENMQYPDLSVVQAERIGGTLVVDQVRELQRSLALAPYEAQYRVAVLLRFEEAHLSATNALLKTLEEPPSRVVLIITAESSERLPPTIVSRCEVLRLRPLSPATVEQGLQNRWGLPDDEAHLLAHISGGRPGYALNLHQNPELQVQRTQWLTDQYQLITASRVERFAYAEKLTKGNDRAEIKASLQGALQVWLSFWRDVLLQASDASIPLSNPDQTKEIQTLATHAGLEVAYNMIVSLERTMRLLNQNVNPRLATEVVLLGLPSIPLQMENNL